MTLSSLSSNETWWQIWINKPAKLQYFQKLSFDCNSKPFQKACKPYFSNKNSNIQENLMLLEKDKLLSKQKDVASTLNTNFGWITYFLNLFSWPEDTSMSSGNDTINSIIKTFASHRSTKTIKKKIKIKNDFFLSKYIYRDPEKTYKWSRH